MRSTAVLLVGIVSLGCGGIQVWGGWRCEAAGEVLVHDRTVVADTVRPVIGAGVAETFRWEAEAAAVERCETEARSVPCDGPGCSVEVKTPCVLTTCRETLPTLF